MIRKRKNNNWRIFVRLLLVATGVLFCIGIYNTIVESALWQRWLYYNASHNAVYKAFGIPIPDTYQIHGIDVSHHQGYIDWDRVKAMRVDSIKIGFVFMKATEGVHIRDKKFQFNWKASADAGMVRGAYHFFRAYEDGIEQANYFIEHVALRKGDLPPVLDVEDLDDINPSILRDRLQACLHVLENHYGVRPIIYTNADFYKKHLIDMFDDYPLWVAHYKRLNRPGVARPWHFWQHSESGHVNGIVSNVDFNVFSGDAKAFKALLIP